MTNYYHHMDDNCKSRIHVNQVGYHSDMVQSIVQEYRMHLVIERYLEVKLHDVVLQQMQLDWPKPKK